MVQDQEGCMFTHASQHAYLLHSVGPDSVDNLAQQHAVLQGGTEELVCGIRGCDASAFSDKLGGSLALCR
jgi:hypothetical protein